MVSAGAGGGYDTLARTLARFLHKHLPGNPIIVVRNMAAAAGLLPPTLCSAAPRRTAPLSASCRARRPSIRCSVRARRASTRPNSTGSARRARKPDCSCSGTRCRSRRSRRRKSETSPSALPAQFDARLSRPAAQRRVRPQAQDQDRLSGFDRCFLRPRARRARRLHQCDLFGFAGDQVDWLPQKKIKALLQYGPEKRAELAGVPSAREVAKNDEDRILLDAAFAPLALGRPLVMPPGVPADRLAAMRKAIMETFADRASSPRAHGCHLDRLSHAMARRCRSGRGHLRGTARSAGAAAPIAQRAALDFDPIELDQV